MHITNKTFKKIPTALLASTAVFLGIGIITLITLSVPLGVICLGLAGLSALGAAGASMLLRNKTIIHDNDNAYLVHRSDSRAIAAKLNHKGRSAAKGLGNFFGVREHNYAPPKGQASKFLDSVFDFFHRPFASIQATTKDITTPSLKR